MKADSIYHIDFIDDVSKKDQYDKLRLYVRRRIFACSWYFRDFTSPEDVISELYIQIKESDVKNYDADFICRKINSILNKQWRQFLKSDPKLIEWDNRRVNNWKKQAREDLNDWYIIGIIQQKYKNMGIKISAEEIRRKPEQIKKTRDRLLLKRNRK